MIAAVVAALMYQPLSAQFNPGGLGKALKDKAKAKDQQKKDEQEKVPAKSLEGPGVYFPVSQS
ncbi:MAG: hypothetical protein ABIK62_05265, partial [candidate division WOR-3 bacterium]